MFWQSGWRRWFILFLLSSSLLLAAPMAWAQDAETEQAVSPDPGNTVYLPIIAGEEQTASTDEVEVVEEVEGEGAAAIQPPATPPVQICGNAGQLNGPATPPTGAIVVPAGDNSTFNFNQPGATFYFASGIHTLGNSEYGQIIPANNTTFIGAPGAILDGQQINKYAFTQQATGVTIKYLTIRNFGAPPTGATGGNMNEGVVNHDAGSNWTIQYNTIAGNQGAGVFVGSNNVISYNCLEANGQYGFSMFRPQVPGGSAITNIAIRYNEIRNNNTENWEARIDGCGCTGGGKFWDVNGAIVTGNWVHHNKSVGLWADTNNINFLFEGNYINDNDAEGIFYELSYNFMIRNNTLKRNALIKGQQFASRGDNFPVSAIYISEAGGDARVSSAYALSEITGNYLEDNWSGVVLWENADRFCGSAANTSGGYCTKGGVASFTTCVAGAINNEPYYSDCRWKTKNILVANNDFRLNKAAIGCTNNFCGQQALLSNFGTYPEWSPYKNTVIQDAITLGQNNLFRNNRYIGQWTFTPYAPGRLNNFAAWQSAPYHQDLDSNYDGIVNPTPTSTALPSSTPTATPTPVPTPTPTVVSTPLPINNVLDVNTATLERSLGKWSQWYSANLVHVSGKAHGGTKSLRVTVSAPYGWGIQLSNYPGFAVQPGNKAISFWAARGKGTIADVQLRLQWVNASGSVLRADVLRLSQLNSQWRQASGNMVAPPGTTRVFLDFSSAVGNVGDIMYLDDIVIANN